MDNRQLQLERASHVLRMLGVDTANAKVMDRTHYIAFDAKGKGSVVKLLNSNTRKLTGITSLDANKFNKGRHFVIDGIRVIIEATASDAKEASWKSNPDKAILNSELTISQDGDIITLPLTDLVAPNFQTSQEGGFRSIASAPVLLPEQEFQFSWEFPDGVGVDSSTTQLVRIEFRGFEFFTI